MNDMPVIFACEVTAILDALGDKAIRVREGGGFENVAASLAVTCSKMESMIETANARAEWCNKLYDGREKYLSELVQEIDTLKEKLQETESRLAKFEALVREMEKRVKDFLDEDAIQFAADALKL